MTYDNVIVGTDGSATAMHAVRTAVAIAKATGARLHLVTAWYRDQTDGYGRLEAGERMEFSASGNEASWAAEVSVDAAAIARDAGVDDVTQHTLTGAAADVLLDLGDTLSDPLIVVGTKGLGSASERLLGNVPHSLTHHAGTDLFLVARPSDGAEASWQTVMLATDGSTTASRACARGLALAEALGATPSLTTVGLGDRAEAALTATAAQLGRDDIHRRLIPDTGPPANALARVAAGVDLLVMGNKGMSGPSRLLGSVPNRVTHAVTTDVLLVNTTR